MSVGEVLLICSASQDSRKGRTGAADEAGDCLALVGLFG